MKQSLKQLVWASIWAGLTINCSASLGQTRHADTVVPSVSAGGADQSAAKSSEDEIKIRDVQHVFDLYIDGWRRADTEALSKVYAADARVTGIWPDPTLEYPVQGWPEVRRELERVFDFTHGMMMNYSPRHVEIYGDVAIMTTNWEWTAMGPAQPDSKEESLKAERRTTMSQEGFGKGQATFVFFHRDGKWVLVHEHASVLPVDK
jgi:ketosteroid isomerase-like protein